MDCNKGSKGSLPAPSIFEMDANGRFELCDGVQLHMFISQPPCGDACVLGPDVQPVSRLPANMNPLSASTADVQQSQPAHQHNPAQHNHLMYTREDSALKLTDMPAETIANGMPAVTTAPGMPTVTTVNDMPAAPISTGRPALSSATGRPHNSSASQSLSPLLARMHMTALESTTAPPPLAGSGLGSVGDSQGNCSRLQQAEDRNACTVAQRPVQGLSASMVDIQLGPHSRAAAQDNGSAQPGQQLSTGATEECGGVCRKPGRGDATLSMSCSDKLARWVMLGVQVCCNVCTIHAYHAGYHIGCCVWRRAAHSCIRMLCALCCWYCNKPYLMTRL